ncbi:MAG: AmmeMemoRadiSam system protein B [Bacteroidota bacterium]
MGYLAAHQEPAPRPDGTIIGGISPHDDFLYAGRVYYPLFAMMKAPEVIVIGLTHGTVRKEVGDLRGVLLFDDFDQWAGPYGPVSISPLRSYVSAHLDTAFWRTNRKAQMVEHSIEAIVPFLQYYQRDVKIFPIMVTAMSLDRMKSVAEALSSIVAGYVKERHLVLGKDLAVIISTDANHYGADFGNTPFGEDSIAHARGTALDREIITDALTGTVDTDHVARFVGYTWGAHPTDPGRSLWCGKFSVPFGLLFVADLVKSTSDARVTTVPLAYSDTWTEKVLPLRGTHMGTTAPFSLRHWVGWCSVAFVTR